MRLVHVVPHISEEASGPSYSVPRLCEALAARGHDVELSCLTARNPVPGVRVDLHRQWPLLSRFAISPSHALALRRKAAEIDVVHNHSLWSMVNVAAGWVVPGGRAKLVTSPRGTLSAWALSRSRYLKDLLWPLQRRALQRSDLLHATSEVEYREIRSLGFRAPVAIISNGIDLPVMPERRLVASQRTLLFLGRIHPIKGVDRLLLAWQQVQEGHPDWRLVVAGRGEAAQVREIRGLGEALKLRRVELPGPIYGADKSRAYFAADLFVLPSHSENFGMAVAEALAHGCPAMVSKGAPWSGLEAEQAGWWVDHRVDTLAAALDAAMRLSSETLVQMGARGREWMRREFGWESVAASMDEAYQWLLGGGATPPSIRLD